MSSSRRRLATTAGLMLLLGMLLGSSLALPLTAPLVPLPPPPLPILALADLSPKLLAAGGLVSLAAKCVGSR
jgi:hypothetical protein